jgi:hypothetical protein
MGGIGLRWSKGLLYDSVHGTWENEVEIMEEGQGFERWKHATFSSEADFRAID